MADDVRRSGRANKGHHTKNQDLFDEPPPLPKPKMKSKTDKKGQSQSARSESAQSGAQQEPDGEEEAIIRCVCGDQRDIRGRQMICCDRCSAWQHVKCLGLQEGEFWNEETTTYFCEQCKPEDHVDLLAAMARGEKPWNRKKGNKAAKFKSRPSDVHSEATSDTPVKLEHVEKPQKLDAPKVHTPHASSTAIQAPVPVPQAPIPVHGEVPTDVTPGTLNGHTEHSVETMRTSGANNADPPLQQQTKKSTPKRHPLSPLGEKRGQDAISEKEVSKPKRRKSSTYTTSHPVQTTMATDPSALPDKQRLLVMRLIDTLAVMIKQASDDGKYRIPDGATPSSIATRLALQIDHAAITHHGEPTDNASPYVLQVRSIVFNAKKNSLLVDRLLSGSLGAEDIATMSAEEMASDEKQQEYAAMREANEKQMVLTEVAGPRLRKTHKGEEIVGEDEDNLAHEFRPPERRDREAVEERAVDPLSPNRDGQAVVELPEDVGVRAAALSLDTSNPQPDSMRQASTNFDIDQIFNQVRSPQKDQATFLQRRQSLIRTHEKSQDGPGDDADVDRLLKDEDNDVEMTSYSADPTIVWQGTLDMQTMGPFDAVARFVAGGDFGQVVPWDQLLSSRLPIQGRIESQRGNEYIQGLATSGSHDVGVLSINPVTHEGRVVMDHLYNYFHPRDRWGVVPVEKLGNEAMRDLYVIPIPPGGDNLPPFLEMLEYCTIETPRKDHMILLALVAKLPDVRPQFPSTEHFDRYQAGKIAASQMAHPALTLPGSGSPNGPLPSPVVNPHGPSYSPMGSTFPQEQVYRNHLPPQYNNGSPVQVQHVPMRKSFLPHEVPHALEILGPRINDPVVIQLLAESPGPEIIMNIRSIMELEPAARTNMEVFRAVLARKSQNGGDQQIPR